MSHLFVETNWLFAYAAPAHHKVHAAKHLLERARRGELILHLPNLCVGEARRAIRTKCQPRAEADALRRFLTYSTPLPISEKDASVVRVVLDKYESAIKESLSALDDDVKALAGLPYVDVYGLDETMLSRATELAIEGICASPFDQAILASVLVKAERLWDGGARGISFCETDSDLQPWGKTGAPKPELQRVYDDAHVWVYGDFALSAPQRPAGFP